MKKCYSTDLFFRVIRYSGFSMFLIAAVFSCDDQDDAANIDCSGTDITFAEVNDIIQSNCASNSSCHASGSRNGPGPLLTYSQIYSARTSIRSAVASGKMPQGSRLSSNEKNAVICWINNGASSN